MPPNTDTRQWAQWYPISHRAQAFRLRIRHSLPPYKGMGPVSLKRLLECPVTEAGQDSVQSSADDKPEEEENPDGARRRMCLSAC